MDRQAEVPVSKLFLEERRFIQEAMIYDLGELIYPYEIYYNEVKAWEALRDKLFTKERYQAFETWVRDREEVLALRTELRPWDEGLIRDVAEVVRLYEALQALALGQEPEFDIWDTYKRPEIDPSIEKKVAWHQLTVGGKSAEELVTELEQQGCRIEPGALLMMKSLDFVPSPRKRLQLVSLTLEDLFNGQNTYTREQIMNRAAFLGLDLCPAEAGPRFSLAFPDLFNTHDCTIAIKPIHDGHGLGFFVASKESNGRGRSALLTSDGGAPNVRWHYTDTFVFCVR